MESSAVADTKARYTTRRTALRHGKNTKASIKSKRTRGYILEFSKMAATYSPTTRSTIGDAELNDPVRNGKGWDLSAITT